MYKIFLVKKDFVNSRIDRWVKTNICVVPQSFIEKSLRNKKITVNKKKIKSSYKVKLNDEIHLNNFNPTRTSLIKKTGYKPSNRDIRESDNFILSNNENFCVINKPQGLSVQGGSKVNKNLIDLIAKNNIFVNSKPFVVHRIDKETSGILLIAKNRQYAQLLTSLFRIRKIHKTYLCICHGKMQNDKGEIDTYLNRYERNKNVSERAISTYKVLDKQNDFSFLALKPITGRKHQIRKQLLSCGHPVIGDSKYTNINYSKSSNKNLMLHAYSIKFMINNKKYSYSVNVPDYFKNFLLKKKLTFPKYF
tara:strand:- start:491 stop:1408 length:918 start_codon:yes stop_codon:yes gene_type:complete